jgi:uncharacterized protein (TIGR03083 family)
MSIAITETYGEHPAAMSAHQHTIDAAGIARVTRREAYALARSEYARLLALIESLNGDDWHRPSACTLWDVKSMVGHIAGALAGHASWREFARQYSPLSHRPYRGRFKEPVDYVNAVQVEDRAERTTEELIAEMRAAGPKALRVRSKVPKPVRLLRVPAGPFGFISAEYLLDTIYARDMWMHRLDINRATGREMVTTPEHDGRIVALVLRDLARLLPPKLGGASVLYELRGEAGGTYRIGSHLTPSATITMDVLDFNVLASGRMTSEDAVQQGLVTMEGNLALANLALENTSVPY